MELTATEESGFSVELPSKRGTVAFSVEFPSKARIVAFAVEFPSSGSRFSVEEPSVGGMVGFMFMLRSLFMKNAVPVPSHGMAPPLPGSTSRTPGDFSPNPWHSEFAAQLYFSKRKL